MPFPLCGSLLEWWSIVKYQIPSTKPGPARRVGTPKDKSQGFLYQVLFSYQVSVFPYAAMLQTGFPLRANRFQFFVFLP